MGPIRGGFVEGIGLQAVLTAEELPLVLSFDGTRTLAELVDALDGDDGITPDESAGLLARLVRAGQVELLAPR
jgi:hypothetical protein